MITVKARSNTPHTRAYQPVWELLKKPPYYVNLEVHPSLVARVKKAVSKEKYMDISFKEEYGHGDEDHFYLKFTYYMDKQRLKIELVNRYGVDMIEETE